MTSCLPTAANAPSVTEIDPTNAPRLLLSPDRKTFLTFGGDQAARLGVTADQAQAANVPSPTPVTCAAFSPDGRRLATGEEGGTVQLWDSATGQPLFAHPPHHASKVFQVVFSADGTLLASGGDDNTARIWDAATGLPRTPPIKLNGTIYEVAFGTASHFLFTRSTDGVARVWDARTGDPLTPDLRNESGDSWRDRLHPSDRPKDAFLALGRAADRPGH